MSRLVSLLRARLATAGWSYGYADDLCLTHRWQHPTYPHRYVQIQVSPGGAGPVVVEGDNGRDQVLIRSIDPLPELVLRYLTDWQVIPSAAATTTAPLRRTA